MDTIRTRHNLIVNGGIITYDILINAGKSHEDIILLFDWLKDHPSYNNHTPDRNVKRYANMRRPFHEQLKPIDHKDLKDATLEIYEKHIDALKANAVIKQAEDSSGVKLHF